MVHLVYGSHEEMRFDCAGVELNTQSVWTWQGTFQQPANGQRPVFYDLDRYELRVAASESGEETDLYRKVLEIESPLGVPLEVRDEGELLYSASRLLIRSWQGAVTLHDPVFERKVAEFGFRHGHWHVGPREIVAGLHVGTFAYFDGLPYVAPVGVRQRLSPLATSAAA